MSKPTGLAKMKQVKVMAEVEPDAGDKNEKDEPKEYDEWELKDAADTLSRAEEIKADPHKMAALKPHLERKAKAYKSLSRLKAMSAAVKATDGK